MFRGRVAEFAGYRIRLSYSGTLTSTGMMGNATSSATVLTRFWGMSNADLETGLLLNYQLLRQSEGAVSAVARFEIAPLGIGGSFTLSGLPGSSESFLELDDVRLYANPAGPRWDVTAAAWRWVLDGVVRASGGAISLSSGMSGSPFAPIAIPLFGVPASFSAHAAGSGSNVIDLVYPASESHANVTFTGGWEVRLPGGAWTRLPVHLAVRTPPAITCASGTISTPGLAITQTVGTLSVAGFAHSEFTGPPSAPTWNRLRVRTESAAVTLVPSMDRTIQRVTGADYAALWFRWGFPRTTEMTLTHCYEMRPRPPPGTLNVFEVHPRHTQMLSTVGAGAHTIEEPLTGPVFAPYLCRGTARAQETGVGDWFGQRESEYPHTVEDRSLNVDLPPYAVHGDPHARIVAFWGSPHWHYAYFFPSDGAGGTQGLWPVDGAPIPSRYWFDGRWQWLEHPALPEVERRRTRTTLPAATLGQSGFWGWFQQIAFGFQTSWIGMSRFIAQPRTVSTRTLTGASAPAWTAQNTTLAFEATRVRLDAAGAGVRTAELDLGRYDAGPFMLAHAAGVVVLAWDTANVSAITFSLLGVDGREVPLPVTSGVPLPRPRGESVRFAGSWAQNFGQGIVSDTGADSHADGVSLASMADAERRLAFQLLHGFTASRLRVRVTPSDPALAVRIHYPEFRAGAGTWWSVPEHGGNTALVQGDGPGIRHDAGYFNFATDSFIASPGPTLKINAGSTHTLGDWLCWRREVLEGLERADGLDAELATLFEGGGSEYTLRDHFWRDPISQAQNTHSFVWASGANVVGIMAASLREVAPLCTFPHMGRGANLVADPAAPLTMRVWDWATEPRYLVTAGHDPAELVSPASVVWTAPITPPPVPGWSFASHRQQVTNTETGFRIRISGADRATVRPWHSWLCVPSVIQQVIAAARMCRDEALGFLHAVVTSPPGLVLRSWNETKGVDRARDVVSGAVLGAAIAISPETRMLHVVYSGEGADAVVRIWATASDSQGLRWSVPQVLWAGNGAANAFDSAGREYVSYWAGGRFEVRYRRAQGEAWQGPFTIALAADPGVTALEVAPFADAPLVVVTAVRRPDGTLEVRRHESGTSGRTWRETT